MEERRNRTARRILKGTVYPHNIHPALDFYHAGSGPAFLPALPGLF
ncbi:hypothetical protein HMPREF0308_1579 [Corynebacterium striatum ATCC 6940]|nr:hypothetical protein HMPREF0308_1579 [Corynebacterium striatum ATCC 6940]